MGNAIAYSNLESLPDLTCSAPISEKSHKSITDASNLKTPLSYLLCHFISVLGKIVSLKEIHSGKYDHKIRSIEYVR